MLRVLGSLALLVAPAAAAVAQDGPPANGNGLAETTAPLNPDDWKIGAIIEDLAFTDLDGRAGHLSDYADKVALVVVIRDVGCPVSKQYGLATAEIEKSYAPRDVAFLYVNTGKHDTVDDCKKERAEYGFVGRYARDLEGRFGFHFKVRTTTDVFVLDAERKLRYRGAIDDQVGVGVVKPAATKEFLKDALEALLKREPVKEAATTAPGCPLGPFDQQPPAEPAATPELTWNGRISRIVQERCNACHHPGGAGPFELATADQVIGRKAVIRRRVLDRVMPPWFATDSSGPFVNNISLKPNERLDLLRWLQGDCPEGDPKDAPPPREYSTGWNIGEPDLVVPIPKPVDIPAKGVMDYVNVEAPTNLDKDVWVDGIQIKPDNPEICHHVLVNVFYPDDNVMEFLDSLLPGKEATRYPEGQATLLRKGALLRFNLHYTPNGKPCKEQTKVGIHFARAAPKMRVYGKILRQYKIDIPANCPDYTVVAERKIPFDADLRKFIPHMHLRGKSAKVELFLPDGTKLTPLELRCWDPNWQYAYVLEKPIHVPAGTLIKCTCVFDNTKNNKFNPDPTKRVREGPQIWQEMAGSFVEWLRPADLDDGEKIPGDPNAPGHHRRRPADDDDDKDGSSGG